VPGATLDSERPLFQGSEAPRDGLADRAVSARSVLAADLDRRGAVGGSSPAVSAARPGQVAVVYQCTVPFGVDDDERQPAVVEQVREVAV